MDDSVPFGSRAYEVLVVLLLVARGMDFLSTWVATPNLVLEGNPIAKKLGWRWGIPLNLGLCFMFALWPMPAVVVSTTSVLVAARNLQQAWLMRSMGEQQYRDWHLDRLQETSITLYLLCLFGQTLLTGGVGAALIYFTSEDRTIVPLSIGVGIVAYALAVLFFTLLGIWRLRRSELRVARIIKAQARRENRPVSPTRGETLAADCGAAPASLKEP
jgi:hypothetical protein